MPHAAPLSIPNGKLPPQAAQSKAAAGDRIGWPPIARGQHGCELTNADDDSPFRVKKNHLFALMTAAGRTMMSGSTGTVLRRDCGYERAGGIY